MEYFDRRQDEGSSKGKPIPLSGTSLTSYTSSENTFCLKFSEDAHESTFIFLTAKDER
jgi:hypothetical protein